MTRKLDNFDQLKIRRYFLLEDEINELFERKQELKWIFDNSNKNTRSLFDNMGVGVIGFNVASKVTDYVDLSRSIDDRIRNKNTKLLLFQSVIDKYGHLKDRYINYDFVQSHEVHHILHFIKDIEGVVKHGVKQRSN